MYRHLVYYVEQLVDLGFFIAAIALLTVGFYYGILAIV